MRSTTHSDRRPGDRPASVVFSLATLLLIMSGPTWAQVICPDGGSIYRGNMHGEANSTCTGTSSTYGEWNAAIYANSNAVGAWNISGGNMSNAYGSYNFAEADSSSAFGVINRAVGVASNAFGSGNTAYEDYSNAFGMFNRSFGKESNAFGSVNQARGINSNAFGSNNFAGGDYSSAFGHNNTAAGEYSSAFGTDNFSLGAYSSAFGVGSLAHGKYSNAFGYNSSAFGEGALALGHGSTARGDNNIALGAFSISDSRINTVAVGSASMRRQIINVEAATQGTDAVNLFQMEPMALALGGNAHFAEGVFMAPTYSIQGVDYHNVGDAFFAVDQRLNNLSTRLDDAVFYDPPSGGEVPLEDSEQVTLKGQDGTRITNLADGVEASDAVNKGQMDAGDAETLQSAKEYTDTTATKTLASAKEYTDQALAGFRTDIDDRFRQMDKRIDKMAAMSGAYAGMAMNTAGLAGRNRVGVGVGGQGGEKAMAVGYQRAVGDRASVSIGAAFGGGEKSLMGGAGFSW
jgi:autotransporter adhesin